MTYKEYTDVINKAKKLNINISIMALNNAIKKYDYDYIINNLENIL